VIKIVYRIDDGQAEETVIDVGVFGPAVLMAALHVGEEVSRGAHGRELQMLSAHVMDVLESQP
jgi:hypothetical protein